MTLVSYRYKSEAPGTYFHSTDDSDPNFAGLKSSSDVEIRPAAGMAAGVTTGGTQLYAKGDGTVTATPPAFNINSPNSPITSSDPIRQASDLTRAAAANGLANFTNWDDLINKQLALSLNQQTFGQTDQGQAAQAALDTLRKSLGIFNDQENKQIEDAGKAAATEFDPLITEATRAKEQGIPKALIGGGEQGGFMNTQYAGRAALVPTNGNNFIGAGGEFENIQSVYDNNISNLKAKQQSAALAAKEAYRQALRTGKRQDYDLAEKAFQTAKSSFDEANALAKEKVDAISKYQTQRQARVTYDLERMQKIGEVGGTIPDDLKTSVDAAYGPGFTDKYAAASKAAKDAATSEKQIEAMGKITDILKNYPLDQEIKIGNATYKGIANNKDSQIFQEEDAKGNVTFVTIDKRTGEIIHTASGGKIGKGATKSGSNTVSTGLSSDTVQKLLNSRGADGYVDTALYSQAYDEAVLKGPKTLNAFLDQVPVSRYLNPNDPTAERFVRTQAQTLPKSDRYNDKNIPANVKDDLLSDIKAGKFSLTELEQAYPDVDSALVSKLFKDGE